MFDEMYMGSEVRDHYSNVRSWVTSMPKSHLLKKNLEVENKFKDIGITFSIGEELYHLISSQEFLPIRNGQKLKKE